MTNRARPDDDVLPFAVSQAPRAEPKQPAQPKARRTPKRAPVVAAELPIARVVVDVSLAHLDRPFDYQVPESLAQQAIPGVRVRVRFAGQLVDGFVTERVASSEHGGRLA